MCIHSLGATCLILFIDLYLSVCAGSEFWRVDRCCGADSGIVGHGLSYPAACGISVPRSGVPPSSPAWEGRISATGASRTSPSVRFLISPGLSLLHRPSPASYGICFMVLPASCLRFLGTACVDGVVTHLSCPPTRALGSTAASCPSQFRGQSRQLSPC